jgi:hypothetical protein
MFRIITLHIELKNLKSFSESILDNIKIDSSDIDKYNEEIYDDGDFLEIFNPKFEKLYGHENLLIKFIFYELNVIREYYLNSAILDYYFSNFSNNDKKVDILALLEKHQVYINILSENNYNYDSEEAINYVNNCKTIDYKNIIELLLLYGNASRIPKEHLKIFENSIDKRNKKANKSFFEYYSIRNNQYWNEIEEIRKIANSFKHRKGFKSFVKDGARNLGEKYEPTINDALEKINITSKFFHDLYILIKNDYKKT